MYFISYICFFKVPVKPFSKAGYTTIIQQISSAYDSSIIRWILTTQVPYERPSLKYTPKLAWNLGSFSFSVPRARKCTLKTMFIKNHRFEICGKYKWMGKSFMHIKDTVNYENYNIFNLSVVYFPLFLTLPIFSKSLSDRTGYGFEIQRSLNNSTSNTSSIVCLCKIKSLQFIHISWMNVST